MLDALHFAHWEAARLDLYLKKEVVHIDAVPHWAAVCGVTIGADELSCLLPPGHPASRVF